MFWKKERRNVGCTSFHSLCSSRNSFMRLFPALFGLSLPFTNPIFSVLMASGTFSGVYAVIVSFLMFSMIQFRDGPFIRPHPAFWRMILGVNLLYQLALVFLLFEDLDSARSMMKYLDPNLGVPLPEKSYAEDCTFSLATIWVCFFRFMT